MGFNSVLPSRFAWASRRKEGRKGAWLLFLDNDDYGTKGSEGGIPPLLRWALESRVRPTFGKKRGWVDPTLSIRMQPQCNRPFSPARLSPSRCFEAECTLHTLSLPIYPILSIPPFCPLLPSIHSHCRPSSSYGGEEGGLPGSWGGEQIGFPTHLQQPFASPLPLFPERPQPIPALLPLSCMRSFALPSKRGGNEEGLPPSKAGLIEERVGEATNQPFPPFAFLQALREGASEGRASSLAQVLSLSILSSDPAPSPRQRPPPPPPRRVLRRRSPTPTSKRKRKVFSSLPLLRPPPSLHYVRRTVKTSLLSPRRDWK